MSINNDGGRAFPRVLPDCKVAPMRALEVIEEHAGMSLRDYFAAAALMGIVSAREEHRFPPPSRNLAAVDAYEFADAMIARNK